MNSAMDYAKSLKRSGLISLFITLTTLFSGIMLIYLSSVGVVKNLNSVFLLGLLMILLVSAITTAMFYSKSNAVKKVVENPLIHWQYEDEKEAIISEHGLYYSPIHDKIHTFWSNSSKLESLKLGHRDEDSLTMDFYFIRAITQEGNRISAAIQIPVPKGQEAYAEKLVENIIQFVNFNKTNHKKRLIMTGVIFLAIVTLIVIAFRIFNW